jgi:alkanesulfonate monooxygenase SsuD/methylene tetrahydromethanopterin reductase-like flavin-dependent oxidoreductase (luciferase family)
MVSPATFRHPSVLAKMAVTADHASGGRIEVGLGTGWFEGEHAAYGFAFPPLRERMEILAEQLEIVHGQWTQSPFAFSGRHYEIAVADHLPKPVQRPHPPLVMGGSAGPRAARLAATYADEYNTVFATVEQVRERRAAIVAACEKAGRRPIAFSLMATTLVGRDAAEVERRASELSAWQGSPVDLAGLGRTGVAGTVEQAAERLRAYADAGAERAFLQCLLHRDLDMVELIGRELVPAVA